MIKKRYLPNLLEFGKLITIICEVYNHMTYFLFTYFYTGI